MMAYLSDAVCDAPFRSVIWLLVWSLCSVSMVASSMIYYLKLSIGFFTRLPLFRVWLGIQI
jgi:hypothetical protein